METDAKLATQPSRIWPALPMSLGFLSSVFLYAEFGPLLSGPKAIFGLKFFASFVALYFMRWLLAVLRSEKTKDYRIYIALLNLSPILISISLIAELIIRFG